MACTNDKFVINKGMVNEFTITIKQNGTTLPMVIDNSDEFTMKLYDLETNTEVATITQVDNANTGIVTTHDAPNGQIMIKLYNTLVDTLTSNRGEDVDDYYLKPTYRLAIDCATLNNGNFVAKVNEVYVEG